MNGSSAFPKYGARFPSEGSNKGVGPMRNFVTIATVAMLSTGIALAQTPNGHAPARIGAESIQPRLNLTQRQKQAVNRGLSGEPSQNAAADLQIRVGEP